MPSPSVGVKPVNASTYALIVRWGDWCPPSRMSKMRVAVKRYLANGLGLALRGDGEKLGSLPPTKPCPSAVEELYPTLVVVTDGQVPLYIFGLDFRCVKGADVMHRSIWAFLAGT